MRRHPPLRLLIIAAITTVMVAPAAAAAAAGGSAACPDSLVTFSRDKIAGNDRAVSLTSQAIEKDVPGWVRVGWETPDTTTLSAVIATGTDGNTVRLSATPSGVAKGVTSLTFCGTVTLPKDVDAEPDKAPKPEVKDEAKPKPETTEKPEVKDAKAEAKPDASAKSASEKAAKPAPAPKAEQTAAPTPEPVTEPAPQPAQPAAPAPDDSGDGADDAAEEAGDSDAPTTATWTPAAVALPAEDLSNNDDVEVLGVQIVAAHAADDGDAGTADTGPVPPAATTVDQPVLASSGGASGQSPLQQAWLLLAAVAGGIAAGTSAVRFRGRACSETGSADVRN